MTDEEKVGELRCDFARRFSAVGPGAYRVVMVDPDLVAEWALNAVRAIDKGEQCPTQATMSARSSR